LFFPEICDDGNLKNGDGCDLNCKPEKDYACVGGTKTTASNCIYTGFHVSLKFIDSTKIENLNEGRLTFKFDKWIDNFNKVNFT
jgi:cysteine-rich repeat protein